MGVQPDTYLPAAWSLDSANVQAIESSATHPKVRMDSTGLFVTDATGLKTTNIKGAGGGIEIAAANSATPPSDRKIKWVKETNGAVVAELRGFNDAGNSTASLVATSTDSLDNGINAEILAVEDASVDVDVPFARLAANHNRFLDQQSVRVDLRRNGSGLPGFGLGRLLIDNLRRSGWVQWGPLGFNGTIKDWGIQVGQWTWVAAPVGTATITVPMSSFGMQNWSNGHLFVVGSVLDYSAGSGNTASAQFGPNGTAAVGIRVWGQPVVQNITFTVISVGN